MNRTSMLITNSGVNRFTGGGVVSLNMLEALRDVTDVRMVLSNQHFTDSKYDGIPSYCLEPGQYGYSDPFFYDYMANSLIPEEPIDLAAFYACPFGKTVEKLKEEPYCARIVSDLAPHNIQISMDEHLKYGGGYPYPHLTNEFLRGLYLRHLQLSDTVIVHSNSSAKYIMETAKLKELPTVIPHGIYLPKDDEISPYPAEFRPGYFGSLGLDKGVLYLLSAWLNSELHNKYKLWFGGGGSQNLQQTFNLTDEHMNMFNMLGPVQDVSVFYNAISVYVHPSIQDGFGITPLEAMSFKRPVVVSEGAGVSELVTDGKDGFVVPMRSPGALAEKLQYFSDNPLEIARMGSNAYETASKYTWDIIKKRYIDVFKEFL